jgi:hypothetical protein
VSFYLAGYGFSIWICKSKLGCGFYGCDLCMINSDNDMPSCNNSTPHMGVLTVTHVNQVIIIMLIVDLQVLVTGSLHLVGDVLKLLKR